MWFPLTLNWTYHVPLIGIIQTWEWSYLFVFKSSLNLFFCLLIWRARNWPTHHHSIGLPAVCEKTSISVSRAITTWGGTSRTLCLEGLPVEGRSIEETFLLSAGCQWTPVGTTVCGILSTDVTQAVTAWHRTSAWSKRKEGKAKEIRGEFCSRRERRESVEARQQWKK